MNILAHIWEIIRPRTQQEREEEFLARSTDLVDLERRQRMLNNRVITFY